MGNLDGAVNQTVSAIMRWREQNTPQEHRPHLGASLIGHHCERYLWLSFHWAKREQFDGRMLRLFDTGQRAEARFIEELRGIGCEVYEVDQSGQQWRVSALGGHFSGSMDGCGRGIPEAPQTWHVLEFKTHSDKSFRDLTSKGVQESKPQHWAQMQTYMGLTGMTRALYLAVNKNTDELYAERVREDKNAQKSLMERAQRVISASAPPSRLSDDPTWWQCKFCVMHSICHGTETPEVNCRTCSHSTPELSGGWSCARAANRDLIPLHVQRTGCSQHRYIPVLLEGFAKPEDADESANWVQYINKLSGAVFENGNPTAGHYSSHEIFACQDKAAIGLQGVNELREAFGGRVVG